MSFSFLSWNIRHFKGDPDRAGKVSGIIKTINPDVFGLLEFRAKKVMRKMMLENFPEYDFAVTDSKMGIEITVGWKRNIFDQVIWTQRRDFLNNDFNLRPGGLLSVKRGEEFYNLLFLHTDSGNGKTDYENRQAMFKKIWKLNKALGDISAVNRPNLIALGDLNTMGQGTQLTGEDEIEELDYDANRNDMTLLSKEAGETWSAWGKGRRGQRRKLKLSELDGILTSDLDHVIASNDLDFKLIGSNNTPIKVDGWNALDGQEKIDFLWDISDHSAIYGEITASDSV